MNRRKFLQATAVPAAGLAGQARSAEEQDEVEALANPDLFYPDLDRPLRIQSCTNAQERARLHNLDFPLDLIEADC